MDVNNAPSDLSVESVVLYSDPTCMFTECDMCGVNKLNSQLIAQNPKIQQMWEKNIIYFKWCSPKQLINGKEIKRSFNKYWFEVPLRILLNSFYQSCHLISKHLFHFKWQSIQYERLRSTMVIGEVRLVMDFGQNINHRRQFEAQSIYFNCQQSSLFPLVCFFPCVTSQIYFGR